MVGGTTGRIIEERPPTRLLAPAAGEDRTKGVEVSNEDLELNVTDELLSGSRVDGAQILSEAEPL